MKYSAIFILFGLLFPSWAFGNTFPQEVVEFIEKRDRCDHFRGEISGEPEVDESSGLNKNLDLYCKETDRSLMNLKDKYKNDSTIMEKLNSYDEEIESNRPEEDDVFEKQTIDVSPEKIKIP